MADLIINGKDALSEYGVRMGDGFMDSLECPAPLKAYITNSDRLENGVRYADTVPKVDERNVTLLFTVDGSSESDFRTKKAAFKAVLYAGSVDISVPARSAEVYHLKYTGKDVSYAGNADDTFCKLSVAFVEPDPTDRK